MEVKDIPLSKIIISKLNVRKNLEAGHEDSTLDDLAESIRENGLLNPITVIQKDDSYELVVGQRRFLACQKIGLDTIPAIIRDDISDIDGVTLSLIENVHRADMHPIDKARALQNLYDTYGTYQRVSKESGLSSPTIKRYVSLLKLAPEIQEKLSTSQGPAGVGTLSVLAEMFPSAEDQLKALDYISGFNQKVQLEILKRSKGDISALELNRDLALEGAFEIQRCTGLADCDFIPNEIRNDVLRMIAELNDTHKTTNTHARKYSNSSFSENIPDPQFCIKCNAKSEITKDEEGKEWVLNLIGISLDNFVEQYPSIKEMCVNPSLYAIDLCYRCEEKHSKGELDVSFDEIVKHAYRFLAD